MGVLYGITWALLSAVMMFWIHEIRGDVSNVRLLFHRSLVISVLLFPFVLPEIRVLFRRDSWVLWLRAMFGAGALYFFFGSVQALPIAEASAFFATAPLFVLLLSWFVLSDRIFVSDFFGIVVAVTGVLLLRLEHVSDVSVALLAFVFTGVLLRSSAFVCLRHSATRYPIHLIVWLVGIVGLVLAIGIGGTPPSFVEAFDDASNLYLWGAVFCGFAIQWVMTMTYRYLPAFLAVLISELQVPLSGGLGYVFHDYRPAWLEIVSIVLIIGGTFLALGARHFLHETSSSKY